MTRNRVSADHSGGMKAAMAMNSGIAGMVRTASVAIWITLSILPP